MAERKAMSEIRYQEASLRITENLSSLPEIERAQYIHIFWPILKNKEVDTRSFIRELYAAGKKCVLPKIIAFSKDQNGHARMEHCLFSGETNLRANRWDVYEPVSTETVPVSVFDAVIVPALAADTDGFRIGYGKGYYDEFLADVTCPTICLLFDSFLTEKLPTESHDMPVDILVTDLSVMRPQRNAT